MICKQALEELDRASQLLSKEALEEVCDKIVKEAGLFGNKTEVAKKTIEELQKTVKDLGKQNKALKFGNKAWKTVGKAGLATGVAGAGYGLYQKRKAEQGPNFGMYQ
jgi:hypothetical protein